MIYKKPLLQMKLYKPEPPLVLRIAIKKAGEETKYLSVTDISQKQFVIWATKQLSTLQISVFTSALKLSISVRESVAGINGKSKSISLRGVSTEQVYNLLLKGIEENTTIFDKK